MIESSQINNINHTTQERKHLKNLKLQKISLATKTNFIKKIGKSLNN